MTSLVVQNATLSGLSVLEIAAIGPVPFAGMMLADMGAQVTRVDRIAGAVPSPLDGTFEGRGRRSIAVDLKNPQSSELILKLVEQSDVLLEGFRPGVMERLGLGPNICLARNPALVFGRMTGWGQAGPLAQAAGHDLNYIALSGALHSMGSSDRPPSPPLNLVGDYGGGAMMLLVGILAALHERQRSGMGQVVDAAMTDGAAMLMAPIYAMRSHGFWSDERGANQLDGGAHFYGVYGCADGKFISIGSIEPQFYRLLLTVLGVDLQTWPAQLDRAHWPELRQRFETIFATHPREYWCERMEGTDICFAPVLSMREAPDHPHNRARDAFLELNGAVQPAPAPRFSRTPSKASAHVPRIGEDSGDILAEIGLSPRRIAELKVACVVSESERA